MSTIVRWIAGLLLLMPAALGAAQASRAEAKDSKANT